MTNDPNQSRTFTIAGIEVRLRRYNEQETIVEIPKKEGSDVIDRLIHHELKGYISGSRNESDETHHRFQVNFIQYTRTDDPRLFASWNNLIDMCERLEKECPTLEEAQKRIRLGSLQKRDGEDARIQFEAEKATKFYLRAVLSFLERRDKGLTSEEQAELKMSIEEVYIRGLGGHDR